MKWDDYIKECGDLNYKNSSIIRWKQIRNNSRLSTISLIIGILGFLLSFFIVPLIPKNIISEILVLILSISGLFFIIHILSNPYSGDSEGQF
jgi:uncharacterized membrane protein YfcA